MKRLKVALINSVSYGSTGKVMSSIAKAGEKDYDFLMCYPKGRHNKNKLNEDCYMFGNRFAEDSHIIFGRITGLHGLFSVFSTYNLIKKIKRFDPDIIHIHNLHNCYINIPMLFGYIKKNKVSVVWTLHDCWPITGGCPHFEYSGCYKWIQGCYRCNQHKEYPKSYLPNSKVMYRLKKKWFLGVENLIITTPSVWLMNHVEKSFLNEYNTVVINNGVDCETFKPIQSDIKSYLGCNEKVIVLGVAFGWNNKKGLDVFIELSKRLPPYYQIVLVGTNKELDCILPDNIISIHKTSNQNKLAELYASADVFVNTTREEVFGLVNIEALACGTPVITFNSGGSPECIDESCGVVVEKDNIEELEKAIRNVVKDKNYHNECRNRALLYQEKDKYKQYLDLYDSLI